MKLNRILQLSAVMLAMALCVSIANAKHHEEGEYLLEDLKDCKADPATMKKAKAMIKKNGGAPSEEQVDDFIDSLPDKLIDCIDALD
jgi:hypothetical protein